jgi:phasin family protein
MLNTEQHTAAQKANFEALMGLATKAFDGVEQLTALNLGVARAGLERANQAGMAALSVRDPQSLLALHTSLLQPAAEDAVAYGRQVYGIVSSVKADIENVATRQASAAQGSFAALIDAAGKNLPEGSGNGIALFKAAVETANSAFDSLQKAGRQAAKTAEANYTSATGSVTKAAGKSKRS